MAGAQFQKGNTGYEIVWVTQDPCMDHDARRAYHTFESAEHREQRSAPGGERAPIELSTSFAGIGQGPARRCRKWCAGWAECRPAREIGNEFTGLRFEGVTMCMQGIHSPCVRGDKKSWKRNPALTKSSLLGRQGVPLRFPVVPHPDLPAYRRPARAVKLGKGGCCGRNWASRRPPLRLITQRDENCHGNPSSRI